MQSQQRAQSTDPFPFFIVNRTLVCAPIALFFLGPTHLTVNFRDGALDPIPIFVMQKPSPGLGVVQFSDSVGRILINFNEDTNMAGFAGTFACIRDISKFGSNPICSWIKQALFEITLGIGAKV